MYKYILFDFDGTVFDTVEGITKSVRYALNKRNLDAPLESLRCFAGPPLGLTFMEKYGYDEEEAKRFVADYRERYVPIGLYECSVFPGIREMLEALRDKGVKLGIATLKPLHMARTLLEKENMLQLFDISCGADPDKMHETKAEILGRAMRELGAEAESTIYVGDTKFDVGGAHGCGVKCIGVKYGYAAEGELLEAGADYLADTVEELKELLMTI